MLVFSRKLQDQIDIELEDGRTITVTIVDIERGKVRIGLDAPKTIKLWRSEVNPRRTGEAEKRNQPTQEETDEAAELRW